MDLRKQRYRLDGSHDTHNEEDQPIGVKWSPVGVPKHLTITVERYEVCMSSYTHWPRVGGQMPSFDRRDSNHNSSSELHQDNAAQQGMVVRGY